MRQRFSFGSLPLSSGLTRGLTLCAVAAVEQNGAAYSFSPPAGRRWRQPDEGHGSVRKVTQ
ncbi:hypothetical protein C7U60_13350 [Mesorhizobium plurifarium]|nr:hypothetical protein C7U60_13350 [Mesorhizobium plurifarium]